MKLSTRTGSDAISQTVWTGALTLLAEETLMSFVALAAWRSTEDRQPALLG
jgi:hypothetical protein